MFPVRPEWEAILIEPPAEITPNIGIGPSHRGPNSSGRVVEHSEMRRGCVNVIVMQAPDYVAAVAGYVDIPGLWCIDQGIERQMRLKDAAMPLTLERHEPASGIKPAVHPGGNPVDGEFPAA